MSDPAERLALSRAPIDRCHLASKASVGWMYLLGWTPCGEKILPCTYHTHKLALRVIQQYHSGPSTYSAGLVVLVARFAHVEPAKSLRADGNNERVVLACESRAGCQYSTGSAGWHISALYVEGPLSTTLCRD